MLGDMPGAGLDELSYQPAAAPAAPPRLALRSLFAGLFGESSPLGVFSIGAESGSGGVLPRGSEKSPPCLTGPRPVLPPAVAPLFCDRGGGPSRATDVELFRPPEAVSAPADSSAV